MLRRRLFSIVNEEVLCNLFAVKRCKHRQSFKHMFPLVGSTMEKSEEKGSSISASLMQKNKLILNASTGTHYYMPALTRSLEKLTRIIDKEMRDIGGQKVVMPCLSPKYLWEKTGRWNLMGSELFKVSDRNGSVHCLSPTHEEAITSIVAHESPISHKRLPIKLYQIGKKFRDEMRPKHGLLRCKEFEMKDLYTFDACKEDAQVTFEEVCVAYSNILRKLDLPFVTVEASTGSMGGSRSMEFQLLAEAGEDRLYRCDDCGRGFNQELIANKAKDANLKCPTDNCTGLLKEHFGIEVAHAFLLDTKYSDVFNAKFIDQSGNKKSAVMGCFGIGVSRLLASSIEVLSNANNLRYSPLLAPYQVCLIPQKKGYRFEETWTLCQDFYDKLDETSNLHGEVVIDDRVELSIGERANQASAAGYPFTVVFGKKALDPSSPKYELIDNYNGYSKEHQFLTSDDMLDFFKSIKTVNICSL